MRIITQDKINNGQYDWSIVETWPQGALWEETGQGRDFYDNEN